jgi:hypothetical protein
LRLTYANGVILCGAHYPIIRLVAEFRPFVIAHFAITHAFFALAQFLRKRKKDPAFQASSPKNFKGPVLGSAPFFAETPPSPRPDAQRRALGGDPGPAGQPAVPDLIRDRQD